MAQFLDRLRDLTIRGGQNLAEALFPPECIWCQRPLEGGQHFCDKCSGKLFRDYHQCSRCASPLPVVLSTQNCLRCKQLKFRFDRVITLGPYSDELRQAVIRMKKRPQSLLRRAFGQQLGETLSSHTAATAPNTVLLPVPNHWTHLFGGAADVAGELANEVASESGFPVISGAARRIRKTAKQGMLSWNERKANVRGAFEIPAANDLTGRHVILVDDVLTSGSTASELSRQLKVKKVEQVSVLVVARGTGSKDASLSTEPTPS